jgi:AcrR family transcriptional regulator
MSQQKDMIADTFKKHFSHFGYKKTTVDDIARELQISKKTIYQHFSTKEEIFYYVISRVARGIRNRMEKKLDGLATYEEKISQLVHMIFSEAKKWVRENDAFEFKYKYEISELAFKDAFNELVEKLIQEGIGSDEFSPVHVDVTVRFINGIISESMRLISANPKLEVEDEVISAILKLLK